MSGLDDCRALLTEWLYGGPTLNLRERTGRYLDGTEAVAECTECGQDVPIGSGASTLRTLLGRVAAGGVSVGDAADLIETWPASGGAS